MNKTKRSAPAPAPKRAKRGQQMSVGGLLLTLLVALITWWSWVGSGPAAPVAGATPAPTLPVTSAPPTVATATAKPPPPKATPLPQIKVVDSAQPSTPTKAPTAAKKATAQARKVATATSQPSATATRKRAPTPTPPSPTPTPPARRTAGVSGLPTVRVEQLPREARRTIQLIDQGGPFPFDQDDTVFQNREGLLPRKARGYYREYTVITPGEDDRGPRRIVAGDRGELYYTDDHYDSFREVVR